MSKMNNSHDKLIGSLAVLKSDLIESDFISSYIPFVASALLETYQYDETIHVKQICVEFEKIFGFRIDYAPMITIINKCVKQGLVEKRKNATFSINLDKCKNHCISREKLEKQKEKYRIVVKKLVEYYKGQFDIEVSDIDAENNLLAFLDKHSSGILMVEFSYNKDDFHTPKQHDYIISTFVNKCYHEDYVVFSLVQDLATAYLVSSALAYTECDEESQSDGFKNLIVYIDTPLLIRVLGLNGLELQDSAHALMRQLEALNAHFRIFAHTYDELLLILEDCKRWIEDDKYDEFHASMALRTFVQRKFTKADIQEYIDTLEIKLKYYKIQIDDEDYYAGKYYKNQIDDKLIEKAIIDIYKKNAPTFNPEAKESTIAYDVKSISAILKLWDKKIARTYRQAKYVFVTTNNTLAYVVRNCLKGENINSAYKIFPCITDVYLGTNIWLGSKVEKLEDFSKKKLLADCMSLIEPSEGLFMQLQKTIESAFQDSTITEGQYHLLKQKAFTNNYIMNKTLGDETRFTDKIAEELLQEIEKELVEPYKKELTMVNEMMVDVKSERDALLEEVRKKTQREEEMLIQQNDTDTKIKNKAKEIIRNSKNILLMGLIIPLISFIGTISEILPFTDKIKCIILVSSAIIALILGLFVTAINTNFHGIKELLENNAYMKLKIKEYKKALNEKSAKDDENNMFEIENVKKMENTI